MISHDAYMNGEATHREYHAQYVEQWVKDAVESFIGKERILASTDPHLNDIPLWEWDALAGPLALPALGITSSSIYDKMAAAGDYPSLATIVCIYKEAAKQIKEENN